METVRITKVSKLDDGRLTIYPATIPPLCEYIYRAAAGVCWNKDLSCFQSAAPQDWGHAKWFEQIVAVVRSELGVHLDLTRDTEFAGPEADFKVDIVNANEHVQRWMSEQEQKMKDR